MCGTSSPDIAREGICGKCNIIQGNDFALLNESVRSGLQTRYFCLFRVFGSCPVLLRLSYPGFVILR